jgi:hypothetical protein
VRRLFRRHGITGQSRTDPRVPTALSDHLVITRVGRMLEKSKAVPPWAYIHCIYAGARSGTVSR